MLCLHIYTVQCFIHNKCDDSPSVHLGYHIVSGVVRTVGSLRAHGADYDQSSVRVQTTITIPAYQAALPRTKNQRCSNAGSRYSSLYNSETGSFSQRGLPNNTAQCWHNIQQQLYLTSNCELRNNADKQAPIGFIASEPTM